jgi:hypothetical protein
MAFKMAPRSPLMKSLKGGQKNLPEGLKKAIEAAPGKMMDSPAKMGRGERYDVKMASDQNLTAGARKNYAENAEAAQKSSPAKETDPKKAIKAAQAGKAKKKIATPKQLESRAEIKRTVGKLARKAAPKSKKIATPTELDARRKNTAAKGAAAKASRKANGDKKPMPPTGDSPAKNMNKGYGSPAKGRKEEIAARANKKAKRQEVEGAQRNYKAKVAKQELKGVKPNSPEEKVAMKNIDERAVKNRRK